MPAPPLSERYLKVTAADFRNLSVIWTAVIWLTR